MDTDQTKEPCEKPTGLLHSQFCLIGKRLHKEATRSIRDDDVGLESYEKEVTPIYDKVLKELKTIHLENAVERMDNSAHCERFAEKICTVNKSNYMYSLPLKKMEKTLARMLAQDFSYYSNLGFDVFLEYNHDTHNLKCIVYATWRNK